MKNTAMMLVAACLVLGLAGSAAAADTVVKFERFLPISQPGVNLDDIPGGGRPWTLTSGEAKVEGDGTVRVEVAGLVLALDGLPGQGTNPFAQFIATLSCRNADGTVNNLSTRPGPATPTGDFEITDRIALPSACLAPAIFVRGFNGATNPWFAVSGF